jgi:hypothetical protein
MKSLILFLLISTSIACYAQKEIKGVQSGTLGPGKYLVTGTVKVKAGDYLNISPGTTFIHNGNYKWEIYGTFIAKGTKNDSIYFLGKDGSFKQFEKHWGGLRFMKNAPTAVLDYCIINNCYLAYSENYIAGLNVYNGKGLTLTHSRISNCYGWNISSGVAVFNSVAVIDHCKIVNNAVVNHLKGAGIYLKDCEDSQISNSVIAYNHSVGGG